MRKKHNIWQLIRYIISFILGRKLKERKERREKEKILSDKLKQQYDRIDDKYNNENLKDRLDNMFK